MYMYLMISLVPRLPPPSLPRNYCMTPIELTLAYCMAVELVLVSASSKGSCNICAQRGREPGNEAIS